jgi:hypothetical protein
MIELIGQFIAGGVVGVLFGTILIYAVGRLIVTIRDKMVDGEMQDIRKEHNRHIEHIQKEYNSERTKFLELMGKYKRKIRDMKVIDRAKVKELYGDDSNVPETN